MSQSPLDPGGDVSVAIVHYRTPVVLGECLASFEDHRPDRVAQVTVVDNSADESISSVSERFPWAEYIVNDENRYFRRANNQASKVARHPYLLFLNPDTRLVDRNSIALLADVLDRQPSAGIVGPMMRGDDGLLAPQGQAIASLLDLIHRRTRGQADQRDESRHAAGFVDTVAGAALMCRRDDFTSVGGFDECVSMYWEEHELARKFRKLGLRAYYQPAAFIYHRWRKGGTEALADAPMFFEQAERRYYQQFFGLGGRLLYSAVRLRRGATRLIKVRHSTAPGSHLNTDPVKRSPE